MSPSQERCLADCENGARGCTTVTRIQALMELPEENRVLLTFADAPWGKGQERGHRTLAG